LLRDGGSIGIDEDRRAMRAGQRCVKLAALAIEREGVRAGLDKMTNVKNSL